MKESILAASIVILAFIAIGLIILQIVNAKNLKKSKEYFSELHTSLQPGVEVMLTGGIYGTLTRVKEDYVMVEIAKNTEIKVSRYSIKEIL
ncbi:MAG: preprotein translocase subunit YajC [Gallicola sp.]|nr:preprotein translocase subunit YajC [Gallicola sp.]